MTTAMINCTALPSHFPATACPKLLRAISALRETLERRYALAQPHGVELVRARFAEAEALAFNTPFPHLFLPLLAEEKTRLAFTPRV